MQYKILTDTCCDFPSHMYDELDLAVVPLSVQFRGTYYETYTESWLKELFAGLRSGESTSTAAVNPERWACAMEPILAQGLDVLVLAFSSGLSTTYQSAVIAAGEMQGPARFQLQPDSTLQQHQQEYFR